MEAMPGEGPLLLEPNLELEERGIWALESLIEPRSGEVQVVLTNPTGFTQCLEANTVVGITEGVAVVPETDADSPVVQKVSTTPQD